MTLSFPYDCKPICLPGQNAFIVEVTPGRPVRRQGRQLSDDRRSLFNGFIAAMIVHIFCNTTVTRETDPNLRHETDPESRTGRHSGLDRRSQRQRSGLLRLVGSKRLQSFYALMTQDIGEFHGNSQRTEIWNRKVGE